MLCNIEKGVENNGDNLNDTDILEQTFFQLSSDGKSWLKDYLQNLVSLQNIIAGGSSGSIHCLFSKEE